MLISVIRVKKGKNFETEINLQLGGTKPLIRALVVKKVGTTLKHPDKI